MESQPIDCPNSVRTVYGSLRISRIQYYHHNEIVSECTFDIFRVPSHDWPAIQFIWLLLVPIKWIIGCRKSGNFRNTVEPIIETVEVFNLTPLHGGDNNCIRQ